MDRDHLEVLLENLSSNVQVIAAGHSALVDRMDRMQANMNERFDRVEVRLDRVEVRLDRVEVRLDRMDAHLEGVESRLERLEANPPPRMAKRKR